MKKSLEILMIIIGVIAILSGIAYFSDTISNYLPKYTLSLPKERVDTINISSSNPVLSTTKPEDGDIVNALMLEVNAINNIITWCSFIVAVLTIAAAVFGILSIASFREETHNSIESSEQKINELTINLKKSFKEFNILQNTRLDESERETNTRLDNFTEIIHNHSNRVDQFTAQIDNLRVYLNQQERYLNQIIDYLYQATYSIIAQMADQDKAQQLLNHLYHELQIAKLYRVNLDTDEARVVNINKIAALEYLEENGRKADIPHLDYIAQHDPDEHVKTRAIEVRAIIRNNDNN